MNSIDIAVCTYRREHIVGTLRSVAQLELPADTAIRIIVADNDDTPSARERVERAAKELNLNLTYLHAPAHNISIARNACLDAATAPLLAFIDDDELVAPGWLRAMFKAMNNSNADVILGPVRALYPNCPEWMKHGDFHSTMPVWINGNIVTGYAGNVLMKRTSPVFNNLRFRADLGQGGEDTVFFSSVVKSGGTIAFTPEAIVTEAVPPERATLGWLIKRRFRFGQIHGLLLLEQPSRFQNIGKASVKAFYCFACFLVTARYFWLLRGAMHAGVVTRLMRGKHGN